MVTIWWSSAIYIYIYYTKLDIIRPFGGSKNILKHGGSLRKNVSSGTIGWEPYMGGGFQKRKVAPKHPRPDHDLILNPWWLGDPKFYEPPHICLSGERVWSPQCSWTRTLLGGLWKVRNFCKTCTTAGKRAQHLWYVHNISETCTTSLKRAHKEYLKTLHGGFETRYSHVYDCLCALEGYTHCVFLQVWHVKIPMICEAEKTRLSTYYIDHVYPLVNVYSLLLKIVIESSMIYPAKKWWCSIVLCFSLPGRVPLFKASVGGQDVEFPFLSPGLWLSERLSLLHFYPKRMVEFQHMLREAATSEIPHSECNPLVMSK